jgi:hypothetical protein
MRKKHLLKLNIREGAIFFDSKAFFVEHIIYFSFHSGHQPCIKFFLNQNNGFNSFEIPITNEEALEKEKLVGPDYEEFKRELLLEVAKQISNAKKDLYATQ